MRTLLTVSCFLLLLGACSDHSSFVAPDPNPPPPMAGPNGHFIDNLGTNVGSEGGSGGNPVGGNVQPGGSGGGGGGAPVPEPGTIVLVSTGLAFAALLKRRRRDPTS